MRYSCGPTRSAPLPRPRRPTCVERLRRSPSPPPQGGRPSPPPPPCRASCGRAGGPRIFMPFGPPPFGPPPFGPPPFGPPRLRLLPCSRPAEARWEVRRASPRGLSPASARHARGRHAPGIFLAAAVASFHAATASRAPGQLTQTWSVGRQTAASSLPGRGKRHELVANLAGASRGFSAISARPGPRMQPSRLPQPPARPQVPAHRLAPSTRVGGRQPGPILDGRRIYPRRLVYFCQNWGRRRRARCRNPAPPCIFGKLLRGAGIFGPMARQRAAGCARIAAKAARRGARRGARRHPTFSLTGHARPYSAAMASISPPSRALA